MANANAPFGFRPIKSLSGAETQVGYYAVASSASRIGKGDLCKLDAAGTIVRETSATAVGPWIGVSLADTGVISAAISKHPICDDPSALFEVQGSTAALALTDLNTILKVNASTVNTSTGVSKAVLTATAASSSNGVRLVRFVDAPDNAVGASAKLEVRINASQAVPGTAGV